MNRASSRYIDRADALRGYVAGGDDLLRRYQGVCDGNDAGVDAVL